MRGNIMLTRVSQCRSQRKSMRIVSNCRPRDKSAIASVLLRLMPVCNSLVSFNDTAQRDIKDNSHCTEPISFPMVLTYISYISHSCTLKCNCVTGQYDSELTDSVIQRECPIFLNSCGDKTTTDVCSDTEIISRTPGGHNKR